MRATVVKLRLAVGEPAASETEMLQRALGDLLNVGGCCKPQLMLKACFRIALRILVGLAFGLAGLTGLIRGLLPTVRRKMGCLLNPAMCFFGRIHLR